MRIEEIICDDPVLCMASTVEMWSIASVLVCSWVWGWPGSLLLYELRSGEVLPKDTIADRL